MEEAYFNNAYNAYEHRHNWRPSPDQWSAKHRTLLRIQHRKDHVQRTLRHRNIQYVQRRPQHYGRLAVPEGKGVEFLRAVRVCGETILVIRRSWFISLQEQINAI